MTSTKKSVPSTSNSQSSTPESETGSPVQTSTCQPTASKMSSNIATMPIVSGVPIDRRPTTPPPEERIDAELQRAPDSLS